MVGCSGKDRFWEKMMINKPIKLFTLLILVLFVAFSGCKLNKKPDTYTTTLEGISIHVPALTGGVINKLLVDEGNWIAVGDTLAILDTRELSYQTEQIDVSLKQLEIQAVIARNTLSQSRKDVAYVQEKTQRSENLYEASAISKQNVDDLQNLLQKSQTQSTNAQSQLDLLGASRESLLVQKKILLKKISDAVIIAPAKGKVTTLYYRQGEAIPPFANLLEVIDTKSLEAKFYVTELVLGKLKTGQSVTIITESGQTYPAVINHVSNTAEFTPKAVLTPENRTAMVYAVTLRVQNPNDTLKDGMPIEVKL
jgi:HlyD family secretion protein